MDEIKRELRVKLKGAQPSLRGVLLLKEKSDPEVPADKSISDSKAESKENSDTKAEGMMDSDTEADGKMNSNSKADIIMKMTKNSNSKEDSILKMAKTNMSNSKADRIRKMADANMLVATLITTVTFTAAFTVPGGYKSEGADKGKAELSTKAFHVFQMANTLAFGLSITSVFYNYAAMTLNFFQPRDHQQRALFFTTYSILLLVVAFVSGTYAVVSHTMGMITAVVVCCSFFSNQILSLPDLLVLTCAGLTQSFAREEKQEIDEEKSRDDSKASPVQE